MLKKPRKIAIKMENEWEVKDLNLEMRDVREENTKLKTSIK